MKAASSEKSRIVVYRRNPGDPLTAAQRKNLAELAGRPGRPIDTSDIPELPAAAWKNAVRGRFTAPSNRPSASVSTLTSSPGSNNPAPDTKPAPTKSSATTCSKP
jgi:hypothetical protein